MDTGRGNGPHRHENDAERGNGAGNGECAQAETQGLRHWTDEIDWLVANECEDRACAKNERERNHRCRDDDGASNVAAGRARFTRQYGNVLEPTECADSELCENIEAIKDRHGWAGKGEGMVTRKIAE